MSNPNDNENRRNLPDHVRQRMRSVAEREASRLARPDRPQDRSLPHASRQKSAVSSTPSGFQNFKRTIDADDDAGSSASEWCGPFSVARQMIAAREEAKKRREQEQEDIDKENDEKHPLDALVRLDELQKKRKANPSMTWEGKAQHENDFTGKKQNLYYKRQKRYKKQSGADNDSAVGRIRKIPTLYQMCLDFLVGNFEFVEALGPMVDNKIRRSICEQLVATGRMNGAAFDTLAEVGIETLEITDCTEVTHDQMAETLEKLMPEGLRALLLTYCGRCFGKKAVDAITESKINDLFAISISGAYLLKDVDAARLVLSARKSLSSIEFIACNLVGAEFCKCISNFSSSTDSTNLLELSLQNVPLAKDHLKELTKSDALRNLVSLSLRQVDALDDATLEAILDCTDGNLEGIDLSNNINLTDDSLSSIRRCNSKGKLKSLRLCGIKNFTAAGLETFFTFGIPGLPNPPALRTLDLSNGDFESVNETVVNLAITASSLKQSASGKSLSHEKSDLSALGGLVSLDLSGSSISDKNMELLDIRVCLE